MPNRRYEDFRLEVVVILGFTIMAFGFMVLFQSTLANRKIGRSNNTYLQTTVCISSESPDRRTTEYVESCYDRAEAANGTKITHFGAGKQ